MDNLLTLRTWRTVQETAKILSRELKYEINEADVFSYALNHKLMLSVNFAGSITGIHGYYHTTWNGILGMTRFKPSDYQRNGWTSSEALELELTYCHIGRGIVDYIYKKLIGVPTWPLPDEGDLAVNSPQSQYSESADKYYVCYGTVFMVQKVSYNEETGYLQSKTTEGKMVEGGFVVSTTAIQEFIRHAKEPGNIKAIPQPEIAQDEKESDGTEALIEERTRRPEITDDSALPDDNAALFDPLSRAGIMKLFEQILTEAKWKESFNRASRNGLSKAKQARNKYNPLDVGKWLVAKGHMTESHVRGKLRNNLPLRSQDERYLFETNKEE